MRRISIILTLALFAPACDEVDQDGKSGGYQGRSELASELEVCISGPQEDLKACSQDVLAADNDDSAAALGQPDLLSIDPKPVSGPVDDPFGLEDEPISCSSKDGKTDCFYNSGGCCRNQTKCWHC